MRHSEQATFPARLISPHLAQRACEALKAAFVQPPRLVSLALELDTNRFALTRAFKRRFGIAPHAFVLRLRVERACQLMARGDRISQVAFELGFADQAHFCRTFKRVHGVSPSEYVRSRQSAREPTHVRSR